MQTLAHDGHNIFMQQASMQKLINQIGQAARSMEVIHIRKPIGVDFGQERYNLGNIGEILWLQDDPGGSGHGRDMQYEIGRATGGHEAHDSVDPSFFVQDFCGWDEVAAKGGVGQDLRCALLCECAAQVTCWRNETGAGQV